MIPEYFVKLTALPIGYSEVFFNSKKYGFSRTDYNEGKSIKIYGEALDGTNFISFNYYKTATAHILKPCEMKEEKVIGFLNGYKFFKSGLCQNAI